MEIKIGIRDNLSKIFNEVMKSVMSNLDLFNLKDVILTTKIGRKYDYHKFEISWKVKK